MAQLQTSQSIVDFLKSRGFTPQTGERFPLFEQRKQLFQTLGLEKTLGEFRGTAQQNPAILRSLAEAERTSGVSITPENIFDIIGASRAPALTPTPIQQAVPEQPVQLQPEAVQPEPPVGTITETPTAGLPVPADLQQVLAPPTAREIEQEALERVTEAPTFPLEVEAAEAERAAIRISGQQQAQDFIRNIASRGLFFSGAKQAGVERIEADTLARLLNVDRSFANLIVQGLETAAQQVAKEAQQGRAEAIQSLGALGFAVNPATGRIEPTLEARRAAVTEERLERTEQRLERAEERRGQEFLITQQLQQERFDIGQELKEAQFAFNQAKTQVQLNQAQERIGIANERLKIAQDNAESQGKISSQAQKDILQIANVQTNINQLQDILGNIPKVAGVAARATGIGRKVAAFTGFDAAVSTYDAFRNAAIGPIARSISSEVGVLTNDDIKRAEGVLPKVTDTSAERDRKFSELQILLNARKATLQVLAQTGTQSLLSADEESGFEEE